jgi:hypothetical protein
MSKRKRETEKQEPNKKPCLSVSSRYSTCTSTPFSDLVCTCHDTAATNNIVVTNTTTTITATTSPSWQVPTVKAQITSLEEAYQTKCINMIEYYNSTYDVRTDTIAKHGIEAYFYWILNKCIVDKDYARGIVPDLMYYKLDGVFEYWKSKGFVKEWDVLKGYCRLGYSKRVSTYKHISNYDTEVLMSCALEGGHIEIAKTLQKMLRYELSIGYKRYYVVLLGAIRGGHEDCIDYATSLIRDHESGNSIFHIACKLDNRKMILYGLNSTYSCNTLIERALSCGNRYALDLIMNKSPQVIKFYGDMLHHEKSLLFVEYAYKKYKKHVDMIVLFMAACSIDRLDIAHFVLENAKFSIGQLLLGIKCSMSNKAHVAKMIVAKLFVGNVSVLNQAFLDSCKRGDASMARFLMEHGVTNGKDGLFDLCRTIDKHKDVALIQKLSTLYIK